MPYRPPLLAVLLTLAGGCPSTPPTITVRADDGSATLEIPESALPAGVSKDAGRDSRDGVAR